MQNSGLAPSIRVGPPREPLPQLLQSPPMSPTQALDMHTQQQQQLAGALGQLLVQYLAASLLNSQLNTASTSTSQLNLQTQLLQSHLLQSRRATDLESVLLTPPANTNTLSQSLLALSPAAAATAALGGLGGLGAALLSSYGAVGTGGVLQGVGPQAQAPGELINSQETEVEVELQVVKKEACEASPNARWPDTPDTQQSPAKWSESNASTVETACTSSSSRSGHKGDGESGGRGQKGHGRHRGHHSKSTSMSTSTSKRAKKASRGGNETTALSPKTAAQAAHSPSAGPQSPLDLSMHSQQLQSQLQQEQTEEAAACTSGRRSSEFQHGVTIAYTYGMQWTLLHPLIKRELRLHLLDH